MGTYFNKVDGERKPSILASEVGLITKTRLIPATLGTADGNRKVVKQGTIFPLNDNTAEGIVFEDVDVTDGDRVAAVIVAGRVYANRLPAAPSADDSSTVGAKSTLEKSGVVFVDAPETTRA